MCQSKNIVIGGDFNTVLDPIKDKKGGNRELTQCLKYRLELKSFIDTTNLSDIWRVLNEDNFGFTWHCKKRKIFCRLDFWLISDHLVNNVNTAQILPCINSDHNTITLSLKSTKEKRGPSYWKFNSSLLKDKEYVTKINKVIEESAVKHFSENKNIMWELIKMDIRSATISYSVYKQKERTVYESNLKTELSRLQKEINDTNNTDDIIQHMLGIENQLKSIENEKINGIIMRSKIKWSEEGEKNTSFFLNLEKNNYINKHITQLDVNGTTIFEPKQILDEEKRYYETLYLDTLTEPELEHNMTQFLSAVIVPQLTQEQSMVCELQVDITECSKALKKLKNGKTPGIDGLPPEFYKFFWPSIKSHVVESINYSFTTGEMSVNQRLGIITLIPKKDKNRMLLKNWRPISLLTTDYKLITKMIATRLSQVLPSIINNDQTGYIKGRFIGENIRTISDIIEYCKIRKLTGILLLIDFEKAFDTVKWNYMYKVIKKFNFGPKFQKWVKLIYNNIKSTVMNNGYFSSYFTIHRGVRQGCPISAYLFLLIVETLGCYIRNCKTIKGISVQGKNIKISQLADDTTLILQNENSLVKVMELLKNFQPISGLKTNIDKTQAFVIGKHTKFKNNYNLKWCRGPIKMLGISICDTEKENYIHNFEPKLKKIEAIFRVWKQRKLSLKGKITIINSLAGSLLVYPCTCLQTPPQVIKDIQKAFIHFLWDGGSSKIARNTIIKPIEEGGLKMIDLEQKIKSLKLNWIKRSIENPSSPWTLILKDLLYGIPFNYIVQCNNNCQYLMENTPKFYQEIYKVWNTIEKPEPQKLDEILQQNIWLNKNITIQNKPILWKSWFDKGITEISDLLDDNGNFLDSPQLKDKYNLPCNFMSCLQIKQAIPHIWKKQIKNLSNWVKQTVKPLYIKINGSSVNFLETETKTLYWALLNNQKNIPNCVKRWEAQYSIESEHWQNIFLIPFQSCRETYLQSFQYRIIHRILPCNSWLNNIGVSDTNLCKYRYCDSNDIDNIQHFLIHCKLTFKFWQNFKQWWNTLNIENFDPFEKEEYIIFGPHIINNTTLVINFCLILGKLYIYSSKVHQKQISFLNYLIVLKEKLTIIDSINSHNTTKTNTSEIWNLLIQNI